MNIASDYYPCFLGNGLDAVLIGLTGSMTPDKVSVDRCNWYKADRYYPEDKLVHVAGRFPMDKPLEHATNSGWYEIAPLGRTWYSLAINGQPLELQASQQRFVPQEGILYSDVDYGAVRGRVVTFLHATRSLLIERYEFDREVDFHAWMGPGVWVEEGWDTDPFRGVEMEPDAPEGCYDLGETQGVFALRLDPAYQSYGAGSPYSPLDRWVETRGQLITKYFSIADNRQGPVDLSTLEEALALGYEDLAQEHIAFWKEYFSISRVQIPDEQFQRCYQASMYHFKALQNRHSGGLPVNNLRRTWSSHVFWDSYFIQRPLLEAGHTHEALEACRFFQRTLAPARRHAQEEFKAEGIKWDWEITHDGRKAYGVLLHMKDQVHNNASYANQIWQYYQFTRDVTMLREFYPILEGLARFFMSDVIEITQRGYETREVVGVHESPIRVRNDGITLTGAMVILRHALDAARLLGIESNFLARCREAASGLEQTMWRLYNGRTFVSSEGAQDINMSSIAPIYPMQAVAPGDERSLSTVKAYLDQYHGRMIGHGGNSSGFPWSAGVLATIVARQGRGDLAWDIIQETRPAMCTFGGMTEVLQDGEWNMQYFATAQGALCTAIHHLMLQSQGDEIHLFPALPSSWETCSFEGLLASGLKVSASWDKAKCAVEGIVRNENRIPLARKLSLGDHSEDIQLAPGETHAFHWDQEDD